MADTHESGMQIVTGRIELAKKALESRRALEMSKSELPYRIHSSGTSMSSLGAFVDCLSSVSKSVFEQEKGRYLTTTLFTFLLQRPPTQPILLPKCDYLPDQLTLRELIASEFHTRKFVGLLGLISLHDACTSLPPLPRHEFAAERLDDVATLLYYLYIRGPDLVRLLLNLLIEGTIYDKLISVMALGAIVQQSGEVKYLVKTMAVFSEILKQGPMVLQAEVAHVISKFVAIDQTIHDKLPLYYLIGSLVSCLQFMGTEENFQDDINTPTASAFSVEAASRTWNSRKIADEENFQDDINTPRTSGFSMEVASRTWNSRKIADEENFQDDINTPTASAFSMEATSHTWNSAYEENFQDDINTPTASAFSMEAASRTWNSADEENFQDDINTPTASAFSMEAASRNWNSSDEKNFLDDIASAFSTVAPSRTWNSRKIADDRKGKSPEVKARMVATVNKTLRILVKDDSSLCWTVVEGLKDEAFSLRCLGIDEAILATDGRHQVPLLLKTLRGGSLYDKWISVMVLGAIAQQTRKVEHLVEAGVVVVFTKILKEGPMLLQTEVAHVMSKCVAIDPVFLEKLPLDDIITSLTSLLQVEVAEEHLQDDINKATSVLSIVAARHNSNKRKVAAERNEKSMPGEVNQPQQEVSPQVNDRIRATAARALGALAKDNAPACHIIVEKRAILRFAVLLQNERLDVQLYSAMALMEITAVAEKESDLRRSGFKHSSYAHKTVVDQLMRIIREASGLKSGMHIYVTSELLTSCIKAIGNLAATFRVTQPIIPLVHLLRSRTYHGSIGYEVIKETLAALSKFACRDHSFLHLDHSKAIVSLGGLYCILLLAEHEDIGVEKHALVLLCYVAVDALGNESDQLKKVVSAINLASRKGHFSKDEAVKALLQQTKRRLDQLILA